MTPIRQVGSDGARLRPEEMGEAVRRETGLQILDGVDRVTGRPSPSPAGGSTCSSTVSCRSPSAGCHALVRVGMSLHRHGDADDAIALGESGGWFAPFGGCRGRGRPGSLLSQSHPTRRRDGVVESDLDWVAPSARLQHRW